MIRFSNDDLGYLAWIAAHPDGFVLNVSCLPDPQCVILHRSACKSISNHTYEPHAFTGRKHHKICAGSEAELKFAVKSEGRLDGTFSKRCSLCGPWTSVAATLGDKAAEPIDLLSATSDERILW